MLGQGQGGAVQQIRPFHKRLEGAQASDSKELLTRCWAQAELLFALGWQCDTPTLQSDAAAGVCNSLGQFEVQVNLPWAPFGHHLLCCGKEVNKACDSWILTWGISHSL
jgi:hypothetical protein